MDLFVRGVSVKQEHETEGSYITVKVLSPLNELNPYFRVRLDDPLRRLMTRWSERAGVDYHTIRFLLEGRRISEDQTAKQIGLEDDDCIDAFNEQIGGWGWGTSSLVNN